MNPLTAAYAPLYRHLVFPAYEGLVRRRPISRYYRESVGAPHVSPDAIRQRQAELLRALVVHCNRTVPYYANVFAQAGLSPDRISDIADLRDRGIRTGKAAVRDAGNSILSSAFSAASMPNSATSGSTGAPVLFYSDYDNWCRKMAIKYRSEGWFGKYPGTPCTLIWGHPAAQGVVSRFRYNAYWAFQNYRFFSAFDIGEDRLVKYARAIRDWGSQFLECYVTVAYLMARALERRGAAAPPLAGIVVGGERLHSFQKSEIERVFGCPVYNRYGSTEFSNIATECSRREGLHVNSDRLWVEVVDDEDRPIHDSLGEVVVTDLLNLGMPLLRYHTGDRAVLTTMSCSCGRVFPMLRDVVGRTSEVLKLRGGREMHDMYFLWKLSRTPGVRKFRIVQKSLDLATVDIESDGSVSPETTAQAVTRALSDLADFGLRVEVTFKERIPSSQSGKTAFFASEVQEDSRTSH